MKIKIENSRGVCCHCSQRGHMSKDCQAQKYGHSKKIEKAKRSVDRDEDDVVLCLLTSESKKECKNKKVRFTEDVKQPSEVV